MSAKKPDDDLKDFRYNVIPQPRQRSSSTYHVNCQQCEPDPAEHKNDRNRLIAASVLCVLFMTGEIAGGVLSNSLAIATDAAHLLADFAGYMVSLTALWLATFPRTNEMNFGFYRAEVVGAFISVMAIWIVTGVLCYMAAERIHEDDFNVKADIMVIVAFCGVIINIIMGLILCGHHDHHGHGGENTDNENINIKAASLHVLGDLLQSLGVLIAGLIIYFKPEYKIADPICTFLFSGFVLVSTINVLKDVLRVLMEGVPKNLNFDDVKNVILSVPGVVKMHNLRMWSLTLEKTALSAHISIRKGENPIQVLKRATDTIADKFKITEVTLQIEEFHEAGENCDVCTKKDERTDVV